MWFSITVTLLHRVNMEAGDDSTGPQPAEINDSPAGMNGNVVSADDRLTRTYTATVKTGGPNFCLK